MFWFHEFHFLLVAYLFGSVLKGRISKSDKFCIGNLLINTFLLPTHTYLDGRVRKWNRFHSIKVQGNTH